MSIDTLAIARSLRAAELPQPQAEAIAAATGTSILDVAATKGDLAQVESRLETPIEQLKSQIMMWFIATNLTIGAIVIAAVKL
ncbi:MAG: hypothetical protein ABW194_09255 [Novosphingobium sp.]